MAKFESQEEYNQWCEDIISKIYYSNIAMNNEGIKEAVMDIASKLHIPEGECLYDGGEIGSTDGKQRSGELWIDHLMVTKVNANDNFASDDYALAA